MAIMHPDRHLPELVAEKNSLDPSFVHAVRLLAEGKSGIVHFYCILLFFLTHSSTLCALVYGQQ